jgi:hypothetical protein
MFTSANWQLKHIKLHHPEHLHVSNNLTVRSTHSRIEPGQHPQFNPDTDSVEDLDAIPPLEQIETIPDPESELPAAALSQTETNSGAGPAPSDYFAAGW